MRTHSSARSLIPALAGLAVAGLSLTALAGTATGGANATAAPALSCGVAQRDLGDAVEISARVRSESGIAGAYRMTIRQSHGSNSAMIDQSGDFDAAPGRAETLSQTVLGGAPGSYDVRLTLSVNGRSYTCPVANTPSDI